MGIKTVTFNLNQSIKVKLTDLGYQRLADLHNSYVDIVSNFKPRDAEYYKAEADNEGYTKFQAWTFMELFGEVTSIGGPEYFHLDILVEIED